MSTAITLSQLTRRRLLTVSEACAVASEICRAANSWHGGKISPDRVVLRADGSISLDRPVDDLASPSRGLAAESAELLRALRPQPFPGAVSLAAMRAAREIDLPPYETAADFATALARFVDGSPRDVLAALHAASAVPLSRVRTWTRAGIAAAVALATLAGAARLVADRDDPIVPARTTAEQRSPRPAIERPRPPARMVPDGRVEARRPALRQIPGARVFSPSFSAAGAAVFYHRDLDGERTALYKAVPEPNDDGLRIVRLVADGARNYHVRPSPDESLIAFDSDRDGERGVYIADADGGNVRRISPPGFAAVPSWSPDGLRLAYVRSGPGEKTWNVWLHDLASNALVRVTSHRYGQAWGAAWFPDGRQIAYSHEDRLVVADLETGARRVFRSPIGGRLLRTPAVSPDGKRVAFQVHRDGAWLLELNDGSMRRILVDPTAEEFAWDATGRRLAFHSRRSGAWSIWIMGS